METKINDPLNNIWNKLHTNKCEGTQGVPIPLKQLTC